MVLARKPPALLLSEGVCFPADVSIESVHVRFNNEYGKVVHLRSQVLCLARSLIKSPMHCSVPPYACRGLMHVKICFC